MVLMPVNRQSLLRPPEPQSQKNLRKERNLYDESNIKRSKLLEYHVLTLPEEVNTYMNTQAHTHIMLQ